MRHEELGMCPLVARSRSWRTVSAQQSFSSGEGTPQQLCYTDAGEEIGLWLERAEAELKEVG